MLSNAHVGGTLCLFLRTGSSSVEAAVKAAAIGCSDKSGDVRTAGNSLITQLLESFGSEVLTSARSVEGSLKTVAIDAIQKASGGQLSPSPPAASPKRSTFSRLPSRVSCSFFSFAQHYVE